MQERHLGINFKKFRELCRFYTALDFFCVWDGDY